MPAAATTAVPGVVVPEPLRGVKGFEFGFKLGIAPT